MALSKGVINSNTEVLFEAEPSEQITMEVDRKSMAFIIARLTDLYEDPIVATVREVISNAVDTTKRLPKNARKPIEVSVPTLLSESFRVRDYGEGMSLETIRNIYSQYGASTKGTDMNQIGAYGLGAKAPLSYCSSFTVTSTKDGMTTEILITNEDSGNFTKVVSHKKTNEPNGTIVTIPAKESDSIKFEEAIEPYSMYKTDVDFSFSVDYPEHDFDKLGKVVAAYDNDENPVFVDIYKKPVPKKEVVSKINELVYLTSLAKANNTSSVVSVLSGFNYPDPRNKTYRNVTSIYVDLVPGLVDFASSRDSITLNQRFDEYRDTIIREVPQLVLNIIQEKAKSGYFEFKHLLAAETYLKVIGDIELADGRKVNEAKSEVYEGLFSTAVLVSTFNRASRYWSLTHENRASVIRTKASISAIKETFDPIPFTVLDVALQVINNNLGEIVVVNINEEGNRSRALSKLSAYHKSRGNSREIIVLFTTENEDKVNEQLKNVTEAKITFIDYADWVKFGVKKKVNNKTSNDLLRIELKVEFEKNILSSCKTESYSELNKSDLDDMKRDYNMRTLYLAPGRYIKNNLYSINREILRIALTQRNTGMGIAIVMPVSTLNKDNVKEIIGTFDTIVLCGSPTFRTKEIQKHINSANTRLYETKTEERKLIVDLTDRKNWSGIVGMTDTTFFSNLSSMKVDSNLVDSKFLDVWNEFKTIGSSLKFGHNSIVTYIANAYGYTIITDGSYEQEAMKKILELRDLTQVGKAFLFMESPVGDSARKEMFNKIHNELTK